MSRRVVPVSTLVHYLKETMEENPILHGVLVEGEVSNLRIPYSGHWYFSLKDDKASISCVMFASANRRVGFIPKNGDKVTINGDISVYEAGGTMQIIAQGMQPSGIGELYLKLEALKKKLSAEGLFDENHKKELPAYPMDIALITGNQTAGREDVLITLKKRWPIAVIHEYPCPVQGTDAAVRIQEALQKADAKGYDVILLVRGGGSFEDLWCFNDESLARTIYQANTPIVTGIGHETDFTVADYVADVRANTPTGAVETAVPDQNEIFGLLQQYQLRLITGIQHQLKQDSVKLEHIQNSSVFLRPERMYLEQTNSLNYLEERLMRYALMPKEKRSQLETVSHTFYACMQESTKRLQLQLNSTRSQMVQAEGKCINDAAQKIHQRQQGLQLAVAADMQNQRHSLELHMKLLDAYSPLKVMERGYSIATKDHSVISSVRDIQINDDLQIRFKDGSIQTKVLCKETEHGKDKNDI